MFKKYIFLSLLVALVACEKEPTSNQTFSLPEGDVEAGKQVFIDMQCNSCHRVSGVEQLASADNGGISIVLGGEVRHIKTYGELVTAVINPSHKIYQGFADKHQSEDGRSAMRNYNDVMTVTQLVDLVSFLQTQYHLQSFERSQYRAYYPQ